MNDTLTIKDIAPYIPYRLQIETPLGIEQAKGIILNNFGNLVLHTNDWWSANKIKPLLRPLSQLTEAITHHGKNFIPICWLEETYPTLNLHEQAHSLIEDSRWINQVNYLLILHLLEWHYDINNLIQRKLAIEIK